MNLFSRAWRKLFPRREPAAQSGNGGGHDDDEPQSVPTVERWHLDDVDQAHAANPTTFLVPSLDERLGLQPGRSVRLHFMFDEPLPNGCAAERMWVTITHTDGVGGFRGELENMPAFIAELEPGDEVAFHARNIAQVLIPKNDPRWIDEQLLALVSRRVLERRRVGYLVRTEPHNPRDSGWQVFVGDEPPEYTSDPSTVALVSLERLLEIDPALKDVLGAPEGCAFERTGTGFVPVE